MRPTLALPALTLLVCAQPAAGQSVERLLPFVPARATEMSVIARPASFERKATALAAHFTPKPPSDAAGLKAKIGLDAAKLQGPFLDVTLPGVEGGGSHLLVISDRNPKALLTSLKAKPGKPYSTFTATGAQGPVTWHGTVQGEVLLLANDAALLDEALGAKDKPAPGLAALGADLGNHDACLVVFQSELRKGLQSAPKPAAAPQGEGAIEGDEPAPAPAPPTPPAVKKLEAAMEQWKQKAVASLEHLVLAVDLADAGGGTCEVRVGLVPDSPLSKDFAAMGPAPAHPLGALPATAYAMACGFQWPSSLADFFSWAAELMDTPEAPVAPELKARLTKASSAMAGHVQSTSFALGAPTRPGAPLLSGLVASMNLKDTAGYMAAVQEVTDLQNELFKSKGLPAVHAFHKDVVAGVPSWTTTMDLGALAGGTKPAEVTMIMAMVFGSSQLQVSCAEKAPGEVIAVFGGAPELEKALATAKAKGPLAASPRVAATDRSLGGGGRMALYLHPKGLRDLGQTLMSTFMGAQAKPLPEVPDSDPIGLVFTANGKELRLKAAVSPQTLDAFAKFVKAMEQLSPGKPQGAGKPAKGRKA